MIEQQGKVVSESTGQVRVRLGGQSGCAACDAGKGCGAGIFGRLLNRKALVLEFENTIGAARDQAVMVGLPETLFLQLLSRFYLLPLLSGLAGAVAGHYLSGKADAGPAAADAATLAGALVAGGFVLRRYRRKPLEFSGISAVHLLRVVGDQEFESRK